MSADSWPMAIEGQGAATAKWRQDAAPSEGGVEVWLKEMVLTLYLM